MILLGAPWHLTRDVEKGTFIYLLPFPPHPPPSAPPSRWASVWTQGNITPFFPGWKGRGRGSPVGFPFPSQAEQDRPLGLVAGNPAQSCPPKCLCCRAETTWSLVVVIRRIILGRRLYALYGSFPLPSPHLRKWHPATNQATSAPPLNGDALPWARPPHLSPGQLPTSFLFSPSCPHTALMVLNCHFPSLHFRLALG